MIPFPAIAKSLRRLGFRSGGCFLLAAVWLLALDIRGQAPSGEGLFAVFATGRGEFTCRLHFKRAPRTVANFVGLAEGARPWVDFQKAAISRERFYDRTTFHRVRAGFVIQGGSPNGRGTDGPGYAFSDEFHQELKHSRAGILSMANFSHPHTNGSQFFITLAATPWLDNVHSIFGEVVKGAEAVAAIGRVPTDSSENPLEPQPLHSVTILRVGAEAVAFDPNAVRPPLPAVHRHPARIARTENRLALVWTTKANHVYHVLFSADLANWSFQRNLPPNGIIGLDNFIQNYAQQYFFFIESQRDPGISE